jgi:hypothetical protein
MLQIENKKCLAYISTIFLQKKNLRYFCERSSHKKAEEILFKLKKLNESIFINTKVIQLIANEKLLAFAYKTIKTKKNFIKKKLNNNWFLLNKQKLCRYIYQKKGTLFFKIAHKKSFFQSKKAQLTLNLLAKKVVIKNLELVLKAIFKGSFLEKIFFCGKTTSALQKIKMSFGNSSWVIQTRIKSCFDKLKHCLLFKIIHERIQCKKTIGLVRALLNERNQTYFSSYNAGIPQKNVLGGLLCNLFLNKLDYFLRRLKNSYVTSKKNPKISTYSLGTNLIKSAFRRLFYVRFSDTFAVAISGGRRKEVVSILKKIDTFLQKKLFLELEQSRTLLIAFRKSEFIFIGTRIVNSSEYQSKKKLREQPVKIICKPLQLYAPIEKIMEKFKKNSFIKKDKNGKYQALSLERLINLSHVAILKYYNKVIASFLDYFFFVDNYFSMQKKVVFFLRHSCALTLKLKYSLRSRFKVFSKFGRHLTCPKTKQYLTIRLVAKK